MLEIRKDSDASIRANGSTWLLVTANAGFLDRARLFAVPDPDTTTLVWTDAFSSLLSVLDPD